MTAVDQTLTEEATPIVPATEKVKLTPAQESANSFGSMLPSFKNMVDSTPGKKSLARVLKAIVEFPLGPNVPKFLNSHERNLFLLFQELSQHKGVVLKDIYDSMNKPAEAEIKGEEVSGN